MMIISEESYMIDTSDFSGVFTPDPNPMVASVYDVSSKVTYITPSTYTLSATPGKEIPQGGYLLITIPTEITLQSSTLSSC